MFTPLGSNRTGPYAVMMFVCAIASLIFSGSSEPAFSIARWNTSSAAIDWGGW